MISDPRATDLEKAARYRRQAADLAEAAEREIFSHRRRQRHAMATAMMGLADRIETTWTQDTSGPAVFLPRSLWPRSSCRCLSATPMKGRRYNHQATVGLDVHRRLKARSRAR
jgi:hypothetical protein